MAEHRMEIRRGAAVFFTTVTYRNGGSTHEHEVYEVLRQKDGSGICNICGTDGTGESSNTVAVTILPEEYGAPTVCLLCLRLLVAKAEELGEQEVI